MKRNMKSAVSLIQNPLRTAPRKTRSMADFFAVIGIVGFTARDARSHLGAGPRMSASQIILLVRRPLVMFLYIGYAMFKPEKF